MFLTVFLNPLILFWKLWILTYFTAVKLSGTYTWKRCGLGRVVGMRPWGQGRSTGSRKAWDPEQPVAWRSWPAHLWHLPTKEQGDCEQHLSGVVGTADQILQNWKHKQFYPKMCLIEAYIKYPGRSLFAKILHLLFPPLFLFCFSHLQRPFKDAAVDSYTQALPGCQDETLFPFSSEEVEVGHVSVQPRFTGRLPPPPEDAHPVLLKSPQRISPYPHPSFHIIWLPSFGWPSWILVGWRQSS